MRTVTLFQRLAGVSLLLCPELSACTTTEAIAPAMMACSELVTVRFCTGCPTAATTLQLANGYYVLPIGATWQAYLAQRVDGQVLQVGYQLGRPLGPNEYGLQQATITCLEVAKPSPK